MMRTGLGVHPPAIPFILAPESLAYLLIPASKHLLPGILSHTDRIRNTF